MRKNRLHWENAQLKEANQNLIRDAMRVTTQYSKEINTLQNQVGDLQGWVERLSEGNQNLRQINGVLRVELERGFMGRELRHNEAAIASLQDWLWRQLGGTDGQRTD